MCLGMRKKVVREIFKTLKSLTVGNFSAVLKIPQFGDANTSRAEDAVYPAGNVDVSARDAHL